MAKDKILYLDDEELNLASFKFIFKLDYEIYTASTVSQARQILSENEIAVLISDQRMPDMLGTDFLASISGAYPHCSKILLTAFADSGTAIKAINEASIYQFMVKPWNKEKMGNTLRKAAGAYKIARHSQSLVTELQAENVQAQETNSLLKEEISERVQAEKALLQSERKFRQIFNDSTDGIILWSSSLGITDINPVVEKMLGYSKEELQLMRITDLVAPRFRELTGKIEAQCKNGDTIPVEVGSRCVWITDKAAMLTLMRDIKQRKVRELAVLNAIIETEETERRKLAGNLHDDFGPILSSIKMYLGLLSEQIDAPKASDIIARVKDLVNESINIVRSTSNSLSSHLLLNHGLGPALSNSAEKFRPFVRINLDADIGCQRFPHNIESMIYRIVSELLNNTVKHAGADTVEVSSHYKDGLLCLCYSDNGRGFDLEKTLDPKNEMGIGLLNIISRAKTIGAEYRIYSEPGAGFKFDLSVKTIELEAGDGC
jgi:signal transduction histidine kinase